ncbi:MAG TPA: hypothetical protein VFB32_05385 [Rudaea sp.]|nr:hypothetical protein [Rudaea sp.]
MLVALAFLIAVSAGPTYKCKDANGEWSEQACPNYPKALDALERDVQPNADFDALEGVWIKMCRSDDNPIVCVKRQRADYRYMAVEIQVVRGDQAKTAKLVECAAQANDAVAGGTNASQWRYCYSH